MSVESVRKSDARDGVSSLSRMVSRRRTAPVAPAELLPRDAQAVFLLNCEECAPMDCCVCLEPMHSRRRGFLTAVVHFDDEPVASRRVCRHVFHEECAKCILTTGGSGGGSRCPLCRAPFNHVEPVPKLDDNERWFTAADVNRDNRLSLHEISEMMAASTNLPSDRIMRAVSETKLWDEWDVNKSGYIERGQELAAVLRFGKRLARLQSAMAANKATAPSYARLATIFLANLRRRVSSVTLTGALRARFSS